MIASKFTSFNINQQSLTKLVCISVLTFVLRHDRMITLCTSSGALISSQAFIFGPSFVSETGLLSSDPSWRREWDQQIVDRWRGAFSPESRPS